MKKSQFNSLSWPLQVSLRESPLKIKQVQKLVLSVCGQWQPITLRGEGCPDGNVNNYKRKSTVETYGCDVHVPVNYVCVCVWQELLWSWLQEPVSKFLLAIIWKSRVLGRGGISFCKRPAEGARCSRTPRRVLVPEFAQRWGLACRPSNVHGHGPYKVLLLNSFPSPYHGRPTEYYSLKSQCCFIAGSLATELTSNFIAYLVSFLYICNTTSSCGTLLEYRQPCLSASLFLPWHFFYIFYLFLQN